jgi:hypothetical protein
MSFVMGRAISPFPHAGGRVQGFQDLLSSRLMFEEPAQWFGVRHQSLSLLFAQYS